MVVRTVSAMRSTDGRDAMYVGVRCSIVTDAAVSANTIDDGDLGSSFKLIMKPSQLELDSYIIPSLAAERYQAQRISPAMLTIT